MHCNGLLRSQSLSLWSCSFFAESNLKRESESLFSLYTSHILHIQTLPIAALLPLWMCIIFIYLYVYLFPISFHSMSNFATMPVNKMWTSVSHFFSSLGRGQEASLGPVHPSYLSRGSNIARKCNIWLWLRFVVSNPHFKRGHEMRPHCIQSTHPMSEHCLYWLVESHTASVLAARLKAVQVCLSDRTHTLYLLLLFFDALVVIVVRCACPLE